MAHSQSIVDRAVPAAAALSIVVARSPKQLSEHVAAWDELAQVAIEPNPFYESWMLLPAWRAFGEEVDLRVVLVFGPDPVRGPSVQALHGLFPLERSRRLKVMPASVLRTWRHLHCFLGTPLIRPGTGMACMAALFDWLRDDEQGAALLELGECRADGPFQQLLGDDIAAHSRRTFLDDLHARALLRHADDAETLLREHLSTGNRKELNRQRRRLAELGTLEFRQLERDGDLAPWVDQFLALEQAGWKGARSTALGSNSQQRGYFAAIAAAAHRRHRLMLCGLFLNGQPIAMKCNFLAPPGSFAFKIAFDEKLARFSPGVQLELDNVRAALALPDFQWMDSCARSGHFMIERLWSGRRSIATTVVATGRVSGALTISCLPLLRRVSRLLRSRAG